MSLAQRLWRLGRDRRGVAAVELALIAPMLATLILGTTDIARAVARKLAVQQAAARTIEMASAGGLTGTAYLNMQAEAATAAGVASNKVSTDRWLECDGVRQGDWNTTCASGAQIGRYVSLTINGSYTPMFNLTFRLLGLSQNGTIPVTGMASVRLQ